MSLAAWHILPTTGARPSMPRSHAQVIWDFIQGWLEKAEADLQAARLLVAAPSRDYFTAAFHAQQAAEKYLKALLVWHQTAFVKTHDIQHLINLGARRDPSLARDLATAASLTPYGVDFRYPGATPVPQAHAEAAVREAERVGDIVLRRLSAYLAQGRPVT